jgi:glutathione S-transferase
MPPVQFYTAPLSMFGMKVEIALNEKAIPFERIEVAYNAATGYDPRHPEVLRVNPKRQVPILLNGAVEVFDSTQIFEYLEDLAPEPPLWPRTIDGRARARQLEHKADEVYFPHIIRLMGLQSNLTEPIAINAIASAREFYLEMEQQLRGQPYLCKDYTYADIAFFMAHVFGERMGATMTTDTPRLSAWRDRVCARPAVRPIMQRFAMYLRANSRTVPAFLP